MSSANEPDNQRPLDTDKPLEPDGEIEGAQDIYRRYMESRRPLHRARAERARADAKALLRKESADEQDRQRIEIAIDRLTHIIECLADDPLLCVSAEALETEDWIDYDELRYQYGVTGNMPMLLEAFVILVENDVSPGQWILEPLAEAFGRILEDQDPSLVATRLGLQARGSGSTSPLQEYPRHFERAQINWDMKTLIEEFGVSRTNAANAVIEKFSLKHAPKTLVNNYESRTKLPTLVRELLDKQSDVLGNSQVWLTDNAAQDFLGSFPPSAKKYLKAARPPKT